MIDGSIIIICVLRLYRLRELENTSKSMAPISHFNQLFHSSRPLQIHAHAHAQVHAHIISRDLTIIPSGCGTLRYEARRRCSRGRKHPPGVYACVPQLLRHSRPRDLIIDVTQSPPFGFPRTARPGQLLPPIVDPLPTSLVLRPPIPRCTRKGTQ